MSQRIAFASSGFSRAVRSQMPASAGRRIRNLDALIEPNESRFSKWIGAPIAIVRAILRRRRASDK